jgi:hypothetical protein
MTTLVTLPTYRVYRRSSNTVYYVAWCAPERRWHWHSAEGGHRTAHCLDGTPYAEDGYMLESSPREPTPAIRSDMRRLRPKGPPA